MKKRLFAPLILPLLFLVLEGCFAVKKSPNYPHQRDSEPVIYCTDLFHPADDPDDHFDILTLLSLPEIDLKCVILDQGKKQEEKTGRLVLEQLSFLTQKVWPAATGLSNPLKTPDDKGLDQENKYQGGVELILKTLQEAKKPVSFIIVGSSRDVAAAYNRRPDLFVKKTKQLHIFSGQASPTHPQEEYNVQMDVHAFVRIMNSGLPITWNPCTDGASYTNLGKCSFWNATHSDLLAFSSENVKKFILYMLEREENKNFSTYYALPLNRESAAREFPKPRALWGTSVFGYITGRRIVQHGNEYYSIPISTPLKSGDQEVRPFFHESVLVRFNEKGRPVYGEGPGFHLIPQIRVPDPKTYKRIMTSAAAHLLHDVDQPSAY